MSEPPHQHNWQFSDWRSEPKWNVLDDTKDANLLLAIRFVCECGGVKLVLPKEGHV